MVEKECCQEGEYQESCSTDCPYGCNNNGKCETANGENEYSCPSDCKSNTGNQDFSTSTWYSQWNTALYSQQGFGYLADWSECYTNVESCWNTCGSDFKNCVQDNFPVCSRNKCNSYGDSQQNECINTGLMINNNLQDEQASFAYSSAQNSACGNIVRRLLQHPGYLRKYSNISSKSNKNK